MNKIKNFDQFIGEAFDLGFFKATPILTKALTDKFTASIAGDIVKMMNGDMDDPKSWQEPYRQIFRKGCLAFGGAKAEDINKTCNKAQTLQKMAEHYFDPSRGVLNAGEVNKWVEETTGGLDPNTSGVSYEYKAENIDEYVQPFIDILLKTGLTAGDLKTTGTYILEKAIPIMKQFYKTEDLEKMKILTDGQLIDAAKAKELLSGEGPGGQISLS